MVVSMKLVLRKPTIGHEKGSDILGGAVHHHKKKWNARARAEVTVAPR
jgi:hypothetical protein